MLVPKYGRERPCPLLIVRSKIFSFGFSLIVNARLNGCNICFNKHSTLYSRFSHDVTATMFVPQNKETAAIFVSPPNTPGIELYYYANDFFCFRWKTWLLITWMKTNNWTRANVRCVGTSNRSSNIVESVKNVESLWKRVESRLNGLNFHSTSIQLFLCSRKCSAIVEHTHAHIRPKSQYGGKIWRSLSAQERLVSSS